MDGRRVTVRWQVAEDEGFARNAQQGTATAARELGYSIHADVRGLQNDRWYFYRFTSGEATSAVGRLRTTPADGAESPLRFVSASCSHFEEGLFTAYGHLATEEVDLVAHLGDYIYENAGLENRVRKHAGLEILTLEDYRRRYAQYKSDEHLRSGRWIRGSTAGTRPAVTAAARFRAATTPDEPVKSGDRVSMDTWQGYPMTRDRVCAAMGDAAPGRAVVLTGDIHSTWVYDVRRGFDRTERPVIAAEFVATSISSGGDGGDNIARVDDAYLAARPSLKWANNRRGYILHSVTPTEWRADYRVVPFVSRPGAPIQTASQWRLEHGRAGVARLGN
jgi:phosphodiesterase/alkaline phosphatase D-like protein